MGFEEMGIPQPRGVSGIQWIEVDVFEGRMKALSIRAILTGAPLSLPRAHPVGGLVASALKTILLNKGFQQVDRVVVFALPVRADPPQDSP